MFLSGFTSKDLRRGTDSINNSYVFLFFALFFSIILLNVTRSCKKQHREIHYSSSLKCSLFKELTNMNEYLQQMPGLRKQLLKWYHIHHNGDCNSSCWSTSGNNKKWGAVRPDPSQTAIQGFNCYSLLYCFSGLSFGVLFCLFASIYFMLLH